MYTVAEFPETEKNATEVVEVPQKDGNSFRKH
jgi:hypothetical protein